MNKRKLFGILTIAIVIVMVTAAVSWAESLRRPEWRTLLGVHALPSQIIQTDRASKPWNFTDDQEAFVIQRGAFQYLADITYDGPRTYSIIMPYPPQVVHCALIQRQQRQELVFVNYHSDNLWRSEWVVYKMAIGSSNNEIADLLASIGCRLDL